MHVQFVYRRKNERSSYIAPVKCAQSSLEPFFKNTKNLLLASSMGFLAIKNKYSTDFQNHTSCYSFHLAVLEVLYYRRNLIGKINETQFPFLRLPK